MTQHTTVEDQVIDMLHRAHACDFEDITRRCTNLTCDMEPNVSRWRPLESKRCVHARARGAGALIL